MGGEGNAKGWTQHMGVLPRWQKTAMGQPMGCGCVQMALRQLVQVAASSNS